MVMIEIKEDKFNDLYENTEKALKYMGKAMQCLSEMEEQGGGMGERYGNRGGGMGMRDGGMGERYMREGGYGMRDDDDDDMEMGERRYMREGGMGERRGVKGTGRYSRFR